jgi:hypothetical protein
MQAFLMQFIIPPVFATNQSLFAIQNILHLHDTIMLQVNFIGIA